MELGIRKVMKVKIKKLRDNAIMPTYATDGSGAFDIYAAGVAYDGCLPAESATVYAGVQVNCSTGLAFEIPEGYGLLVLSRSGHGFKYATRLANAVGLCDADFRGELMVRLTRDAAASQPLCVRAGDRVAQGLIIPIPRIAFKFVDELGETARGAGGFGSTGA